jgi:hypothetical protein
MGLPADARLASLLDLDRRNLGKGKAQLDELPPSEDVSVIP